MTSSMAQEPSSGQMEGNTLDNGIKGNSMVSVSTLQFLGKVAKVNGWTGKESAGSMNETST
jgi:hypothetical protein